MHHRSALILAVGMFVAAPAPGKAKEAESHGTADHDKHGPGADKGKPDDKGKHDDKGKPEDKGKPDDKGKHDDEGKPGEPRGLEGHADEHHQKLLERWNERKKTADERRKSAREEMRHRWGADLSRPGAQDEIRRHAMTVAKLERIKDIADADGKPELQTRASAALERENARHERHMTALKTAPAASASGGAP